MKTKKVIILFLLFPLLSFSQLPSPTTPAEAVILIKKNVTCNWELKTVDTFKAGNPDAKLKGIAVCMFADMKTLKEAVNQGCNLIITHEPVFYNHPDDTTSYSNDAVFREKMEYIKRNGLVIFRFHDHLHATHPDGILTGMVEKLGLEKYSVNEEHTLFRVPKSTLHDFGKQLKVKTGVESIRIIGNPDMSFTKVAFMAGAPGGQRHIQVLGNKDVEVLIAGEAPEWETYLYANDAVSLGKKKAVIFLGHIKSEEAGMEYCARWLKGFIQQVPVIFIRNTSNFQTL